MNLRLTTRLALAVAGAGLVISGAVLLLRAAWGGLALAVGPLWAHAIVGGGLALVGGIFFLLASAARGRRSDAETEGMMLSAFFEGLRAGRATASRRD